LLRVLDPDVVFRMDLGPASRLAHRPLVGADAVARQVLATAPQFAHLAQPVLVNGEAGALFGPLQEPIAGIGFTIAGGRVAAPHPPGCAAGRFSRELGPFAVWRSSW